MQEVAHKCKLARNLNRLRELLPESYNFYPESFNLPIDYSAFEKAALGASTNGKSNRTYIIKPDDGACGEGIFLTRRPSSVPATLKCVAQVYPATHACFALHTADA
jgi:tubulin polyglutamylase TTLL6/13